MRTRAIVLVAVLAVVAVGVAVFMRSDDESSSSTAPPEAPELVACDALPGRPVDEVIEGGSCLGGDGRTIVVLGWAERTCPDGRVVVWADQGWGYRGDVWQPHARGDGQRVPPDEVLDFCPS